MQSSGARSRCLVLAPCGGSGRGAQFSSAQPARPVHLPIPPVAGGAAEGAGAVQSGEEEAEGGPYLSLQLPDRRV